MVVPSVWKWAFGPTLDADVLLEVLFEVLDRSSLRDAMEVDADDDEMHAGAAAAAAAASVPRAVHEEDLPLPWLLPPFAASSACDDAPTIISPLHVGHTLVRASAILLFCSARIFNLSSEKKKSDGDK